MNLNSHSIFNSLSQLISVLAHPLFIPLYATWILFNSNNYLSYAVSPKLQDFLYMLIFIITFIIPAGFTWVLWQKGWINSLELESKKERTLPLILTLCCYLSSIYFLLILPIPRIFGLTMIGACLAILFTLLINLRWKISMHMIGVGGLMGLFYGFGRYFHFPSLQILIALSVVSGLIAAARLYRGAHSPAQIYMGFGMGFLLEFGFIYLFAPFIIGR
jgi:hypothetical protein